VTENFLSGGQTEQLPRVAVVIVSYNSADVLGGCLRSLATITGVDLKTVVVADNASRDDSLAIAKAAAADLPILTVEIGRNAGYAAAINRGIAAMGTPDLDAVMVLNPDCVLRPDTIALLWRALSEAGRGIAVPLLLDPDGSLQPSLRRMPTVGRALAEAVLGERAGRIGSLGELISDPRKYAEPGPAVWATGAAMLVSTQTMRDIGPWDESFLLYSEETEFALRAADHGWVLWYEPAAVVEHKGGESGTSPKLASLLIVNKVELFRRRHGFARSTAFYLVTLLGESARALMGRRTSRAAVVALLRPAARTRVLAD
jgi:GT2 family glycosyltransferase